MLKSNAKRTVECELLPDGTRSLVKRFHAPGLGRLRDRFRAHAEANALREAARRGLPVPEVRSVGREETREGGRWALRLAWIEGARSLAEVVELRDVPGGRVRLARRIGTLLAAVEASGLRHPDPHAGNVLVDRSGELWLVDLARARFGPPSPARFEAGLVLATARIRDLSDRRLRAVALRAFLRARTGTAPLPSGADLEARARTRQREDVAERVAVWRRESSATTVTAGSPAVVRRRHLDAAPAPGWRTVDLGCTGEEAAAVWSTLVRAVIHRVPAAVPRAVSLGPPHRVEVDVPDAAASHLTPQAEEALRALLLDRGLLLQGTPLVDADGNALVGPGNRLAPAEDA